MNTLISSVVTAGLMMVGAQAFAVDPPASALVTPQTDSLTVTQKATMKDCMDRMTAKNDGTSQDKITMACKQELKTGTAPAAVKEEPK